MASDKKFLITMGIASILLISSCGYEKSSVTGWDYNNSQTGGFQKVAYEEQETGPGLVLVEGGTFTMGRVEQDVEFDWNNIPRRVTVSSFYIDETEVTNFHWLEYLYWIQRTYTDFPMIYKKALPDTLVWRSKLAYNEPYTEYYLRHPSYRDYPVVGVNWLQASDFCAWRSDRVNEYVLIREGVLLWNPNQQNEPFSAQAYLAGQYEAGENPRGQIPDLDPSKGGQDGSGKIKTKNLATRKVRMEDGILLPRYRLPTEAEWEYAAYGLLGHLNDERILERRIYPWNGHFVRNESDKWQGEMMANFVRGRGDYMGVAGHLNDNADATAPVISYWPNDYGLYNMAGNVSEWVMDVYRPLSSEDYDEFRPFRGNVFKTKVLNSAGAIDAKLDETLYDVDGMLEYVVAFETERAKRTPVVGGLDSLETELLKSIKEIIKEGIDLKNRKQHVEASRKVREIFDNLFDDFDNLVQQDPTLMEYQLEVSAILRKGLSDFVINTPGNLKMRDVRPEENLDRRNYTIADNIDFLDGDINSSIYYNDDGVKENINLNNDPLGKKDQNIVYQSLLDGEKASAGKPTSLISDKSRVYKGGSWRDRAYYMSPGTRRYLDQHLSTETIGFRCAMDRIGRPSGLGKAKGRKK